MQLNLSREWLLKMAELEDRYAPPDGLYACSPRLYEWMKALKMHRLSPCPDCGSESEVRLQTPVLDDDGIVRRAYFRCFACNLVSDDYPDWEPAHWHQTGAALWEPLARFWNEWVEGRGAFD